MINSVNWVNELVSHSYADDSLVTTCQQSYCMWPVVRVTEWVIESMNVYRMSSFFFICWHTHFNKSIIIRHDSVMKDSASESMSHS